MPTLSYADYPDAHGRDLGRSSWMTIDQARIDAFAACTDDRQWIHVDRERAAAGPFGTTIAHGYLTLALLVPMLGALGAMPEDGTTVINYGLDKLRFVKPVPSGSRVRLHALVADVQPRGEDRLLASFDCTVEIEGEAAPALAARALLLLVAPA
ncbi:MAG TPA: MaoC family dehydratase [Trueperaceae bacterium]|nr:MaoC family dehydratase [Trueperaceae bacterium]